MKTNQTEGGGTPRRLTHLLLTHGSCPLSRAAPPVHNVTRQKWETLINHPANPMRVRLSITNCTTHNIGRSNNGLSHGRKAPFPRVVPRLEMGSDSRDCLRGLRQTRTDSAGDGKSRRTPGGQKPLLQCNAMCFWPKAGGSLRGAMQNGRPAQYAERGHPLNLGSEMAAFVFVHFWTSQR